jgi:hypothetical protein
MSKSINYYLWKDSEIQAELEKYGVKIEPFARKEAITALKAAVMKEEKAGEILTEDEDDDDKVKALGIDVLKKEIPNLMLTRVVFHNTSELDLPYIFVGHNGRAFYLPREVEIDVPTYILDSCIKDAVEDRLAQVVVQNGDIEWKVRKVQRFPYSIVKGPFPAP